MKTSILLLVLLCLNTSALLAEPIVNLISGINIWALLLLEAVLIFAYLANRCINDVNKKCAFDTNNLRLFVTRGKDETTN